MNTDDAAKEISSLVEPKCDFESGILSQKHAVDCCVEKEININRFYDESFIPDYRMNYPLTVKITKLLNKA